MNRRIRERLEHAEEMVGSPGQENDPEPRLRMREHLDRIEQARRDGLLTEEDRSELRARINAERAKRLLSASRGPMDAKRSRKV
jgi:hypothetical protein